MPTKIRLLLFRAFCSLHYNGPSFGMVPVTQEFVRSLRSRKRLMRQLREQNSDGGLAALEFTESRVVWFRWFEEQGETLDLLYQAGWALLPAQAFALSDKDELGEPLVSNTQCDTMAVCPRRFVFTCQLENTDIEVQSESLHWDDFRELGL